MNEIILTILLTLLIHSFIGTIIFIITKENEKFAAYYAVGCIGIIASIFCRIVMLIKKLWKYHDKRSIFEDKNGNKFYCKVKYTDDFRWHYDKLIKRYAIKDEWQKCMPFTKEQIANAQRNCDRCKYNGECTFEVKCKHDEFGVVTEFDKFERR